MTPRAAPRGRRSRNGGAPPPRAPRAADRAADITGPCRAAAPRRSAVAQPGQRRAAAAAAPAGSPTCSPAPRRTSRRPRRRARSRARRAAGRRRRPAGASHDRVARLARGRYRPHDRSRRRRRAVGPLQARRAQRVHPQALHHAGPEGVRGDPHASIAATASSSRRSTATSPSSSGCSTRSSRDDRGQVVARTYLTSETGKVYTMLAHAAGRFDELAAQTETTTGALQGAPVRWRSLERRGPISATVADHDVPCPDLADRPRRTLADRRHLHDQPRRQDRGRGRGRRTDRRPPSRPRRMRALCALRRDRGVGVIAAIEAMRPPIAGGLDRAGLQQAMAAGAARNALDCAFWDLEAKRAGRPAHELAGHRRAAAAGHRLHDLARHARGRWRRPPRKAADRALLKVKLGGAGDPERIAAVRRAAPQCRADRRRQRRLDRRTTSTDNLAACAAAGVTLVEQPLPDGHDDVLAAFRRPIPICADESVHARAFARRAASANTTRSTSSSTRPAA